MTWWVSKLVNLVLQNRDICEEQTFIILNSEKKFSKFSNTASAIKNINKDILKLFFMDGPLKHYTDQNCIIYAIIGSSEAGRKLWVKLTLPHRTVEGPVQPVRLRVKISLIFCDFGPMWPKNVPSNKWSTAISSQKLLFH